ncbi:uncharacterized protein METZ01_LOCUS461044, partial [marine metagenome]
MGISQEILLISPNQSYPDTWDLQVTLIGENTNWYDPYATPSVSFSGSGIDVNSVNPVSSTELTAQIDIQSWANVGLRDIIVSSDGQNVNLQNGFEVRSSEIISLTPSAGVQGESNIEVTLVAGGVNFYDPYGYIEEIYFSGEGLSTSNYQVTSETTVNFELDISSGAPPGSRNVYLNSQAYEITKIDAFTVEMYAMEVAYNTG